MRRADREVSDKDEIEEIIGKADVCRIALANDNLPYIVTMNFGYRSEPQRSFYFHCANEGKKLDMIRRNNQVCFELDTDHLLIKGKRSCDWGMSFSSVIGYGEITILTENEEKKNGLNCIMKHYSGEGEQHYDETVFERTTILRLDIKEMTCKKKR
jgi:nitroimidazol reductase NimA-like FMN-containing flavoprotein (pyridoxamine 5'-phosphate oxidase superfamily)